MDYEQAEIEEAISLAASICVLALKQGCSAGFGSNLKLQGTEDTPLVHPLAGSAQIERLLDTFARIRINYTLRFETYLKTLELHPGTDLLILTCYLTDEMNAVLNALRRQGHRIDTYILPTRT